MKDFTIRKATIDDIDKGLLGLFIEGYKYHQNGRPDIFKINDNKAYRNILLNSFKTDTFICIISNNNMIGYLSYEIKGKPDKKFWIDEMIITEKYRSKGLGKLLIDEGKKIAIDNNCKRIEFNCWTFNENALEFYDHLEFSKQRIVYEMSLD